MEKIFEVASRISTPLALAAFVIAALFLVARQILLKEEIYRKLTRSVSAEIIKDLIKSFFVLALVSVLLGFAAFILPMFLNRRVDPAPIPNCTGRSTAARGSQSVAIESGYDPSGAMGDVGDITIERGLGTIRFIYAAQGRMPHEWDWKYVDSALNPEPAQFAGVMYLDPPNNWGSEPGLDLRGFKTLKWEARSIAGNVLAEFVIGGIVWQWDGEKKKRMPVACPDSMPRTSLGLRSLGEDWQPFEYGLSDIPDDDLACVIGGFGWVINWGSNGVRLNGTRSGPAESKTFTIEVRNVRYER